ncbi:MAG: hypothetical protein AVDCRST_MAG35-2914, partial [uncultured Quadrisphaera sp.]
GEGHPWAPPPRRRARARAGRRRPRGRGPRGRRPGRARGPGLPPVAPHGHLRGPAHRPRAARRVAAHPGRGAALPRHGALRRRPRGGQLLGRGRGHRRRRRPRPAAVGRAPAQRRPARLAPRGPRGRRPRDPPRPRAADARPLLGGRRPAPV